MLTTLLMSLGTPMLLGGDEFYRTQKGNNNAYCQDNELSWFDWSQLESDAGHALSDFVRRLTAVRRYYPLVRANRFLHGEVEVTEGVLDIDWFDERGAHMNEHDWHNAEGRALAMRRVRERSDGSIESVIVLMNASSNTLTFKLPSPPVHPYLVIDSADPGAPERKVGDKVPVKAHAAVVIVGNDLPR